MAHCLLLFPDTGYFADVSADVVSSGLSPWITVADTLLYLCAQLMSVPSDRFGVFWNSIQRVATDLYYVFCLTLLPFGRADWLHTCARSVDVLPALLPQSSATPRYQLL